jgi:hypothetical protein
MESEGRMTVKYRNELKAVLIEIDMVHGDIYEVMIFEDVTAAMQFCSLKYKARNWFGGSKMVEYYIDETRRLEIRTVREVEQITI